MCDAPWTSGCKSQNVAVLLQDTKGHRLLVCHDCWNKVPKNWQWGKRKRRTKAEIARDNRSNKSNRGNKDNRDKAPPEKISKRIKQIFDNYVPFGKHAWVRKDVWKKMKASKKELERIIEEEGKKSLIDEDKKARKHRRRKKRGKKKRRCR